MFGGSVAQPEEGADGDAEQDAKAMADDLEVAWEMLEVARVIYSRYPDELAVEKELARVYMRLGDLGMESDVFEQAKSDYEKSLMLRQKILKETKDPDTTLLADLYCCLAISCIYQDSSAQQQVEDAAESADLGARQEEIRKHENEGLKYYVLAGRVMAENIHRVVASCAKELQDFVQQRIPKYGSNANGSPVAAVSSKGKGKQKATADKQELLFTGGNSMDAMKDEFLTCVQVFKALKTSDEVADSLTKDEAQLLEYMEIYGELKEKVDGIIESANAEAIDSSNNAAGLGTKRGSGNDDETAGPVTTIGFGAPTATATTTVGFGSAQPAVKAEPVNVISVKKRKVTPTATAATSTTETTTTAAASTTEATTTTTTKSEASVKEEETK